MRTKFLNTAIAALILFGAAATGYALLGAVTDGRGAGRLESFRRGALSSLVLSAHGRPAPEDAFADQTGRELTLAAFRGKPVLVNFWATWCAPCVEEMPSLAALQTAIGAERLEILPISLDQNADRAKAIAFIAKYPPLKFYIDSDYGLPFEVGAQGFPTSILYDTTGREIARLSGKADWRKPEVLAFVRAATARP